MEERKPKEIVDPEKLVEEIKILEEKTEMMYGLPFLYGWKWYTWAREFFESRNKLNFLCAANQISKSSSQIRKAIHWATCKELWPQLWAQEPKQFWYLYPSQEVVNAEFELKWSQFLPRGKYKDDPYYGWERIKGAGKDTIGIKFNSGIHLFFKTYSKNVSVMQTGTVDAVFCDEELPENLYDELTMRTNATDGYFHMVFTATLGQELWRKTMEPRTKEEEVFPTAAKWTVSLYEAKYYEDGTASHWTDERIAAIKAKCKTHAEYQKRVLGRFVMAEGRKYQSFDASKHVKPRHPLPANWLVYAGIDPGSGGEKGHPAAICFIGVSPDYRQARVFAGWRGDKIETDNSTIMRKYLSLVQEMNVHVTAAYYDWANKDIEIVARGMGVSLLKADKSRDKGEETINTLFHNEMMYIYEDAELSKLCTELANLSDSVNKKYARDDFCDALRYGTSSIPFDFSGLVGVASMEDAPEIKLTPEQQEIADRRKDFEQKDEEFNIEQEFAEWNEAYG